MFNRFDADIKREVDAANTAHGLKGSDALDPNLLKSLLFQESQLGTSGFHLEDPPSHPVKSRFNLGQVIDSSGNALLLMLEKEQPDLIRDYFLGSMRAELSAARAELASLRMKRTRTPVEQSRLEELVRLSGQSWETFIWSYRAAGRDRGFSEAVAAFFGSTSPARNLDYPFWIHMAVLWLFDKKRKGMTWADTIRAYNGSGAHAEHYRAAVLKRAAEAAARRPGSPLIPSGI
jgi:hypothetical protein